MRLPKFAILLLVIGGALSFTQLAAAQGCAPPDGPPCSPNPVPCAHCNGTWTDDDVWPNTYEVFSEPNPSAPRTYNVSGTATKSDLFGEACKFTYTISGTIVQTYGTGTTELSWTMTDHNQTCTYTDENGNPLVLDSVSFTFNGRMSNNSCDIAAGALRNVDGSYDNPGLTMTKPADIPDRLPYETSTAVEWSPVEGTKLRFEGTIQASSSFAGRQVWESTGSAGGTDSCWDQQAGLDGAASFVGVTGGGWYVGYFSFGSEYYPDVIGYPATYVDYYRSRGKTPCSAIINQNMNLYTQGTSSFELYKQNVLQVDILDSINIRVTRDGRSAQRQWGITTTSLPNGTQGTGYSQTLSASLGPIPYRWSVDSGTLPAGLTLNPNTGVISGTPAAMGTSTFKLLAVDASNEPASRNFSITIDPPPLSIATVSLPSAMQGSAYSASLTATGGTTPYTWSIASGSLPSGLSLAGSTGVISGIPTAVGTSSFTVQVSDANLQTATKALSITVNPPPPAITIASLPNGTQNTAYSTTLTASGGTTPYTWTLVSGSLPVGLTLAASTGVISGTPTATGTSNFTVQVSDASSQTASQALSITITPAPIKVPGQVTSY